MPARRACRGRRAGSTGAGALGTPVLPASRYRKRVMPQVLDIEQAVFLLEIDPPFDKRDVQLARRRLAKQWHPDIAPPGKQHEHERHLKAINEAADQLSSIAEDSRGGRVSKNAVKVAAAAARKRRAEEGAKRLRRGAAPARAERRPGQARPVRLARARPLGRAPLRALPLLSRVGRRQRQRHLLHRRRRRHPAVGARLLPARHPHRARRLAAVRRLQQARPGRRARRALHDRGQARAGRGQLQARRPPARLRARRRPGQRRGAAAADAGLLAGGRLQRGGALRARLDPLRAGTPRARTATRRASTRTWARCRRRWTPPSARPSPRPSDASAWERLGRLRLRRFDREGARDALERARVDGPSVEGLLDLALVRTCWATSAPRSAPASRRRVLAPESEAAWARYAHALARTDRVTRLPRGLRARAGARRRPRGARPARPGRPARPARAARGLAAFAGVEPTTPRATTTA